MMSDTLHSSEHFHSQVRSMNRTALHVGDFASAQKAIRSPPPLGAVNYVDANMASVKANRLSITEQ